MTSFDTSALIQKITKGEHFEEGSISVITLIEFLRGIEDEKKRNKALALIKESFSIPDVRENIAISSVKLNFELKKKGKIVSDADLLIAVTASVRNETLVTLDQDFRVFESMINVSIETVRKEE